MLLLVIGLAPAVASADPVLTIYVQVSSATVDVGQPPIWSITAYPNDSELPPGTQLIGHAECSQVFVSGNSGPTMPIEDASNTYDPTAGTFQFVDSSCTQDAAFPVQLSNTTGSYNIVLVGGTITVVKTPTEVHGLGAQTFDNNGAPTATVLKAVVTGDDDAQLANAGVVFAIDGNSGIALVGLCPATITTTNDGLGNYIATCTLDAKASATLYAGDGGWTASFSGDANHGPSSYRGQLQGLVSAADAALRFKAAVKATVHIVAVQIPPNCNPLSGVGDNGSLLEISLGELSCSQLKVLQIVTGVVLGAATIVTGGADVVFDAISQAVANSQYAAFLLAQNAAKAATFAA